MEREVAFLKTVSLFYGLREESIPEMLNCLGTAQKQYVKGQDILTKGDAVSAVGILLSGSAQVIQEDFFGNRSIIAQLAPADLFAETFVCAGIKKSPVTVIAITACKVLWIQFERIVARCSSACEFHAALIENMLKVIAKKNMIMNQKVNLLSQRSIHEKLMQYFSAMMEESGSRTFQIPFTRSQLADYLCVDRSALSRELSKLRRAGKIKFDKNEFEIVAL